MNEENQVEIMEEEGSAMSDELLNAINEDWDTDVLPGDITEDEEKQEETADNGDNADQQPKSRRTRPLKRRLSRKKPRRKQTSLS